MANSKRIAAVWDVLLGGKASKCTAAECLGVVDGAFVSDSLLGTGGRTGIHTGFNGPATGEGYAAEQAFFQEQLNRLSGRSGSR